MNNELSKLSRSGIWFLNPIPPLSSPPINIKEKIYLIFTSPSNSKTFFRYFKIEKLITNQKVKFLPIGPITAKEIQNYFKKYYRNKNIENINLNQKILKFPENYTLKDCILKIIK